VTTGSTCSVTPETPLDLGEHTWWVQAWNSDGYGPWSEGLDFMVSTGSPPEAATLVSPSGTISETSPTYIWNRVSEATWYRLFVREGNAGSVHDAWYQASEVTSDSTCLVTPEIALDLGEHTWWVQTWNANGYGPWSEGLDFMVSTGSPPEAATLVSPAGSISESSPSYTWNAVSGATYYQLYVQKGESSCVHAQWYQASEVTSGSTCSVTPERTLNTGEHTWWVQTWNANGYGPWSEGLEFIVGSVELSHGIPLTYPGFEPQFRQLKVVKTDQDTYWMGMAETSSYNLYLMQTDHFGRVLIPPFVLTELRHVYSTDHDYQFALIPLQGGGLQVLVSTPKPESTHASDPDLLKEYRLTAGGRISSQRVLNYPDSFSGYLKDVYYEDIQAFRTADEQTIFAAETNRANVLVYGRIPDHQSVKNATVIDEDFGETSGDFFEAAFDPEKNRLYILSYNISDEPSYKTMLKSYQLDGTLLQSVDISDSIIAALGNGRHSSDHERPRLLILSEGLLLTLPVPHYNQDDRIWLVLFDPDTLVHEPAIEVSALDFEIRSADCRYALKNEGNGEIGLAWTQHGRFEENAHPVLYARCSLDGEVTHGPIDVSIEDMRYDPRNPNLFLNGSGATLFYGYYSLSYENEREWHLVCRHQGLDFAEGEPDLAIARPQVQQGPPYATFDSELSINATVSNQGEASSESTTLTLTWYGQEYTADIPELEPGNSTTFSFTVNTPAFLTQMPEYSLAIEEGYWPDNDQVSVLCSYPSSTPIYPEGSAEYTWTVQDMVSKAPIDFVSYSLELRDMETVGGESKDIVISGVSDGNGQFSTVLPEGSHTIRLYRKGYPRTEYELSIPYPESSVLELEPPGDLSCQFIDYESGGEIHPAPNTTKIELYNHPQGYAYNGKGDENGLMHSEIMPGTYDFTASAFGYQEATGADLDIVGGQTNYCDIELVPLERGRASGTIISGGSPIEEATIRIAGTPLDNATDAEGSFLLKDIPYGSYTFNISAQGYRSTTRSVTVDQGLEDIGSISLQEIVAESAELEHWDFTAWNKVEEVPGTFFTNNYKVSCTYGVFDLSGALSFELIDKQAVFDGLDLDINGWKWYYYSVSSSFSLTDLFFAGMDDTVSAAGDLCMLLVDQHDNGFFDFLDLNIGAGGAGGATVVRVDRAVLLEEGTPIWDSYDHLLQYYSEDGPIHYTINAQAENIHNVSLRLYMKITDANYSTGPLFLRDKIMVAWEYTNGEFEMQDPVANPVDYPSFDF
jgi:hypothetical protein